jgi:hypothetical protein
MGEDGATMYEWIDRVGYTADRGSAPPLNSRRRLSRLRVVGEGTGSENVPPRRLGRPLGLGHQRSRRVPGQSVDTVRPSGTEPNGLVSNRSWRHRCATPPGTRAHSEYGRYAFHDGGITSFSLVRCWFLVDHQAYSSAHSSSSPAVTTKAQSR